MIPISELKTRARKEQIQEPTVEVDFVLGWLLLCLADVPRLSRSLVFKGGTALRKLYAPGWRYSEDLDFSVLGSVELATLSSETALWCSKTAQASGLTLASPEQDQLPDKLSRQGNLTLWLPFVGPLGRSARPRRIKIDFSTSEPVLLPATQRAIIADFSDQRRLARKLHVYAVEEILAEKLRSLIQRREPRDLYDTWRLLTRREVPVDLDLTFELFPRKCQVRSVDPEQLGRVLNDASLGQLSRAWSLRLGSQLTNLPEFDSVIRELKRHLRPVL